VAHGQPEAISNPVRVSGFVDLEPAMAQATKQVITVAADDGEPERGH
jgi:hypothetical protein